MFNLFTNGRYIINGERLSSKRYPKGSTTKGVVLLTNITEDEPNNKGKVIGQKIKILVARCNNNLNEDIVSTDIFLCNKLYSFENNLGSNKNGKWEKEGNVITVYMNGFSQTEAKIVKSKNILTIDEETNNFTFEYYIWVCKRWKLAYKGEFIFISPLDCE